MTEKPAKSKATRIEVFGGPRLLQSEEEIHLSAQQSSLLALVFGSDEPAQSRPSLLSYLWPEEEPGKALRCLSQLLYSFGKKIGHPGIFKVTRGEIRRADTNVSFDLGDFNAALSSGSFGPCIDLLGRGFAPRVTGKAGVTGSGHRRFADWAKAREAEIRHLLRRQAENRWYQSTSREEWTEARNAAEALLQMDPGNEKLLRQVMEARTKTGSAQEAEASFREFSMHEQAPDWKPQAETEELFSRVQAILSGALQSPHEIPAEPSSHAPLLGRDESRRLLRATLTKIPPKDLRGVLISGEAGIGKTRLIGEVLDGLRLDGHRIFFSDSAQLEQFIPLNPLIEVFKGGESGTVLRDLEEPWRTVLYGVMPSHFLGPGPMPEAPQIQPGSVPRRLFEAFYQLLSSLVREGPIILVLEDLHWADETTLAVLEFLVRRWDEGRLQLVVSVREEEIRKNEVLRDFLDNLQLKGRFIEVPLDDLEPPDSEALIRHLCGGTVGAQDVAQLRSLAGGNPFFLIELTLEFLAGRLGQVETPQDLVSIPLSIRQVLDRRLSQLSPEAAQILGALAVHSRPLDRTGLLWIAHLHEPECMTGLDQLHHFRLVAKRGPELMISHELVRQTVYQGLTDSRRAWLHERVARHLLQTRENVAPDELAIHFHHAGAGEEAIEYAKEAGDRAEASGAIPEALRFLRIAREHSTDPETVADLIGRMGHLNYLRQKLEEAAPLLELAVHRFRRLGDQARALEYEVERIDCLAQRGLLPQNECLEEISRIKREARSLGEYRVLTKALDVEVHRLDHFGNRDGVLRVIKEAQDCSDKGGPDARCRALAIVALNGYYVAPEQGLNSAREAVSIAMETDDADLQLHALNRLIVVLLYQGRLHTDEGKRAFDLAIPRLTRTGDLNLKFFIRLNRAVGHMEVGELDRARVAFREVSPVIAGTEATNAHAQLLLNEGELGLSTFDFEEAKCRYSEAEGFLRSSSPIAFRTIINAGLGMCALKTGDLAEARGREGTLPPMPERWTFDPSIVATFKANMLKRRGDLFAAEKLLCEASADIKGRLVTAWIKLGLERFRILQTEHPEKARRVLKGVLKVTTDLGLEVRTRTIRGMLGIQDKVPESLKDQ